MKIRAYQPADCPVIARLFYETVHAVNIKDYTPEQVDAWATGKVDLQKWNESFLNHHSLVAEMCGQVAGFGDMDVTGYLDKLYVHKDFQGRGIATAICNQLEKDSLAALFTTHASITAKSFFEKRGYSVVREQQVERRGVRLTNYVMEKCRDFL